MSIRLVRNKSAGEIVRALQHEFFRLDRVKGSHHVYVRGDTVITVPFSKESASLSRGVLGNICKLAGWETRCDFVRAGLIPARGRREKNQAALMRTRLVAEYEGSES